MVSGLECQKTVRDFTESGCVGQKLSDLMGLVVLAVPPTVSLQLLIARSASMSSVELGLVYLSWLFIQLVNPMCVDLVVIGLIPVRVHFELFREV